MSYPGRVHDDVTQQLADLAAPMERARQAGKLIDEAQTAIAEFSRIRREALEELVSDGLTQREIAEGLGMTRSRVGQLLSSGPSPERALIGSGPLTVALGGKIEAEKGESAGIVVSDGALVAYEQLGELARSLGLEAESEIIPPPGMVSLNRTNLVVICGPRLSPIVAQVLDSDTKLQFDNDDDGWHILETETGQRHRSPLDTGENADLAYIGRLPRPDGKGTFLYIAGIHAMGAAGAVHYIERNLAEIYAEVKTRRFSTLVKGTFGNGNDVISSERITPIYRHDLN